MNQSSQKNQPRTHTHKKAIKVLLLFHEDRYERFTLTDQLDFTSKRTKRLKKKKSKNLERIERE